MASKRSAASCVFLLALAVALPLLSQSDNPAAGQMQPADLESDMEANATAMAVANNEFAMDLYGELTNGSANGNVFFSPWSMSNAFAIAYEGARGETAGEMESVFHFPADNDARRLSFMEANNALNGNSNYTLHSANALWVQKNFKVLPEYVDTARQYYGSMVANVNFASPEAADTINDWVKSSTNDTIKDVFPAGFTDSDKRLVITNAIYFKGMWLNPFDRNDTSQEDFQVNGNTTIKVPMMKSDEMQILNYTETKDAQILELPYQGGRISMLILLPKDRHDAGLQSLESSLTLKNFTQWRADMSTELVSAVQMPKFKLKTDYDLVAQLSQMGMHSPFLPGTADFSGIDGSKNLYIDAAIHKAFVDVNEEGTEAAATTAIGIASSSESPPVYQFIADHPFVFVIQENSTGNILFMGRIIEPQIE